MRARFPVLLILAAVAALVAVCQRLTEAVHGLNIATGDLRRAAGHLTALVHDEQQGQRLDPLVMDGVGCCGGACSGGRGEPVVVDVDAPQPSADELARAEALKAAAARQAGIAEL